jgi:hypothetical protein
LRGKHFFTFQIFVSLFFSAHHPQFLRRGSTRDLPVVSRRCPYCAGALIVQGALIAQVPLLRRCFGRAGAPVARKEKTPSSFVHFFSDTHPARQNARSFCRIAQVL